MAFSYSQLARLNPYGSLGPSPATVRRITPPKPKPKPRRTVTNSGLPTTDPYQDVQDWVRDQVSNIIQARVASINAQRDAYLQDLQRQSDLELQRGQAVAQALQAMNLPGQIQQIYGNVSDTAGGLANAFAGSIRDTAAKDAAAETRMVSGTGQEGAVAQTGDQLGNVVYGLGGYIPGRTAGEQGAAFASEAALEPAFATRIGQVKAADAYSQGLEGLKQFTDQLLDIQSQRPQIEQDLLQQYQSMLKEDEPNLTARTLADGRIQYFDDDTGEPVGPPQGPKRTKSSSSSKNTVRSLANGQLQAFNAQGKPVGKPYGPVRESKADSPTKLQARSLANGQIQWFDPTTGQPVGAPQGPKRKTTKKTSGGGSYNLQLKTLGDGSQQWFDPRTGKAVGPKISPPKATYKPKYTASQLGKLKATAYDSAKAAKQGLTDSKGNVILEPWDGQPGPNKKGPQEVLKDLVGHGVPFRIAVREVAKFFPVAKKWFKQEAQFQNTTAQTASYNTPPQVPRADILPTSWQPTHVSDGLGWGTKSAVDLFPGPPGTPVGAPVSGTVVYFHPDGAQGGGSMLIRGDDGYEYWIGHIDAGVPGGTRIIRGSQIAVVSSRHPNPHVHIDRRYLGANA